MWHFWNIWKREKEMENRSLNVEEKSEGAQWCCKNTSWNETKMWLGYMISSAKCRYLKSFTSITFVYISVKNVWLWSQAKISPGWEPLSDLAFVLTCCTHIPLFPCGLSLILSLSLFLSLSELHALTYICFSIFLFLIQPHPSSPSV